MKAYTTGRSLVGIFRACSVSVLLTTIGSGVASSDESVRQQFVVFDGLLSPGKPDLRPTGLVPIGGSGNLWRPGHSHDDVDDAGVRSAIDMYRGRIKIFYIDIENWPLQGVAPSVRTANIEKLTRLADVTRGSATGMRIGFYGIMPGITYWPLVSRTGREPQYRDWKETNKELDTLATHVDVVFPSVYTFYDDLDGWKDYARQTIVESRQYGKSVYAFLMPEFHFSNKILGNHEIPGDFWRAELELCFELADGVVLWGGPQHWDQNAPWWLETKSFLAAHNLTPIQR